LIQKQNHGASLNQVKYNKNSRFSEPLDMFNDQAMNFSSSAVVEISFSSIGQDYIGTKIIFQFGNGQFVFYEALFRAFFFTSLLGCFFLMLYRLRTISYKNMSLEQKLTLSLLFTNGFYNNPLYGNLIVCWTTSYFIDALSVEFLSLFYFSFSSLYLIVLGIKIEKQIYGSIFQKQSLEFSLEF
jgi:hypothetical protein